MFEKLGKFEIRELLGQGAMGEVYLGVDPSIGREVAIKTILPTAAQGAEAKQRFEREARAAGVLNHPHLVTIYEFGEDQGVLFIAMEYVKGHDLEELFREQSLTHSEALEVLSQVCDGLSFAHRNGIVHRDIKPSNIRVHRDGKRLHAKVMDFGVARVSNSDMTATGMVMGTVSYMAPEYIKTGKPDPRSDLFAVGVMLYECLSGRKPFAGDTTPTILYRIVNETPEPLDPKSITDVSPMIRNVLERALAKEPEDRYQTAEDLAKALRAVKDPTWTGKVEEGTTQIKGAESVSAMAPTMMVPQSALSVRPAIQPPVAAGAYEMPAASPRKPSKALPIVLLSLGGLVILGGGGYAARRWWQASGSSEGRTKPASGEEARQEITKEKPTEAKLSEDKLKKPVQSPVQSRKDDVPAIQSGQESPTHPIAPQGTVKRDSTAVTQPASKFSQDSLSEMPVPERKNLGNVTMSEAIQLADKDPNRAVEGFRNAIVANPGNANAYAWLIAILYEHKRFGEIPAVFAKAHRHGISRSQLMSNMRFRMAMQRENMDRHIPGDAGSYE